MPRTSTIRFLTPTTNKKGDLFTRLMTDLFQALGYDNFRLDVQKSGREIDIEGQHRHASRLLRAECKAHEDKMGGTELNTFYGAVTRERDEVKLPIDAYFVSLGGFTETAKSQEAKTSDKRLILLDGPKIISELEHHRLLVDDAVATEQAGQCAGRAGLAPGMLESIELLAYEKGYAKAVYYAQHKQRTHVALIHADGTPLADAPAKEVIEADQTLGGTLHQLIYLAPAPVVADIRVVQEAALQHYQRWLNEECAYVQLDGLPANTDVSPTKLKLERLFIPLKAVRVKEGGPQSVSIEVKIPRHIQNEFFSNVSEEEIQESFFNNREYLKTTESISSLLVSGVRLALLAPPGGGKSTLLKRLATEYGFADQLVKFADEMPPQDWLPLIIRCRDLQDQAKEPFIDLLEKLPKRLSMLAEPAAAFKAYIHESLQLGRVLLLIDGLDEITQESNRKAFTKNLLSFLSLFPQVTLVLTSREAGFRLVADVVASKCETYKLAPFEEADVQRLCVQWHAEVINNSEEVRQKALKLAKDIWENEHIRGLAENPLLLTTLLVVNRRRGGELPKNRTMLYSKAVEVLIQTWNAEAFEPLDEEETLTQLSYLACYMMEKGIQQIGRQELIRTLKEAQQTVPELRHTQTSPANFIKQVEYRSSLLMQVGTNIIEDEEQEVFEFRHLTFQEYLAAKGYVEGYHPRDKEGLSLAQLLAPHFGQSAWREVIPLAVVLAKRGAEETIAMLVARCAATTQEKIQNNIVRMTPVDILRRCLLDEVLISSNETLNNALQQVGRLALMTHTGGDTTRSLASGKFGELYQQVVEQAYVADGTDWEDYTIAFGELSEYKVRQFCGENNGLYIEKVIELLRTEEPLLQLRGLAALKEIGIAQGIPWRGIKGVIHWVTADAKVPSFKMVPRQAAVIYDSLDQLLHTRNERVLTAVSLALQSVPSIMPVGSLPPASSMATLFKLLGSMETNPFESDASMRLYSRITQAFNAQPLLHRDALLEEGFGKSYTSDAKAIEATNKSQSITQLGITTAWYRLSPVTDEELLRQIDLFFNTDLNPRLQTGRDRELPRVVELLAGLGQAGEKLFKERAERREAERKNPRIFVSSTYSF
ncbi:NACHT domain-containing protein [Hymenobacter sp. HMF4947]|uniref:NACHT domain-containing protein n=1 Tax=Hymenobacter ginkgonis TaxID=2682976 RepID=A0A7K1THB9_9BACT|nr:NACHT domain-containing protein [Hymenobacter ginkgonis]MVN77815.1 NACHT domain-containing protein [Hymenobacter ginkgonis]